MITTGANTERILGGMEDRWGCAWAADTSMQRATRTLPRRYPKSPADPDLRQSEKASGWKKGEARAALRAQLRHPDQDKYPNDG
jgi:hypothetical protein